MIVASGKTSAKWENSHTKPKRPPMVSFIELCDRYDVSPSRLKGMLSASNAPKAQIATRKRIAGPQVTYYDKKECDAWARKVGLLK
jgi:hypothetical protein